MWGDYPSPSMCWVDSDHRGSRPHLPFRSWKMPWWDVVKMWLQALQQAGCCAIVLECLPPIVAEALTKELNIPTIGFGAGPQCSGQVLVYYDLLGMMQHPHHAKVTPKFCKQFGNVGEVVQLVLQQYKAEVSNGDFRSLQHSPYKLSEAETAALRQNLLDQGYVYGSNAVEERCKDLPAVRDATADLMLDSRTPMH